MKLNIELRILFLNHEPHAHAQIEKRLSDKGGNKNKKLTENLLVRPWNRFILVPPSSGGEGDIESQDEREWNHIDESRANDDHFFVPPANRKEQKEKMFSKEMGYRVSVPPHDEDGKGVGRGTHTHTYLSDRDSLSRQEIRHTARQMHVCCFLMHSLSLSPIPSFCSGAKSIKSCQG